jgi:hypothetical protein
MSQCASNVCTVHFYAQPIADWCADLVVSERLSNVCAIEHCPDCRSDCADTSASTSANSNDPNQPNIVPVANYLLLRRDIIRRRCKEFG